jgi:hypothetical protein
VEPERSVTLYPGRTFADSIQVDCLHVGGREVKYRLGAQYTRLAGYFGLLDVAGSVDAATLTLNGPINGANFRADGAYVPPVPVDVDVSGIDILAVRIACPSTGNARGVLAAPTLFNWHPNLRQPAARAEQRGA